MVGQEHHRGDPSSLSAGKDLKSSAGTRAGILPQRHGLLPSKANERMPGEPLFSIDRSLSDKHQRSQPAICERE